MPQHGFARDLPFTVIERSGDSVRLRLADSVETRVHYPYAFRLDITARVGPGRLAFEIEIENTDAVSLPYGLGFHPAFPWPFAGGTRAAAGGYAVRFEAPERPFAPEVGPGGLLLREERPIPLEGATLPSIRRSSPRPWCFAMRRAPGCASPDRKARRSTWRSRTFRTSPSGPSRRRRSCPSNAGRATPTGRASPET